MVVGDDVRIDGTVIIKRPELFKAGNHIAIDAFCYFTTQVDLGDYIHIAPMATVIGGKDALFKMGHFTTLAAGCRIICAGDEHLGEGLVGPVIPKECRDYVVCAPVVLENFASLATSVVVMPGVRIAEGSVVGANSFVNRDTEPWTIYVGSPARPIRQRPREQMKEFARRLGYAL